MSLLSVKRDRTLRATPECQPGLLDHRAGQTSFGTGGETELSGRRSGHLADAHASKTAFATSRPEPPPTVAGDRSFRPDVEGLRAIAVLLVVLFHAGVPGIRGGYVGVDVFFVLSGFLITGLLLRERIERGTTSMTGFYARRARRILPMASVVLIVTVLAAYHYLGFIRGNRAAIDGRW